MSSRARGAGDGQPEPRDAKQESLWDVSRPEYEKLPLPTGGIYTKLVGQSFQPNSSKILRMIADSGCRKLRVVPEFDNTQFPEAIGIWCGRKIGFLEADLARMLKPGTRTGELKLNARVEQITGDESKGEKLGCNIAIWDANGTDLTPLHPRMNPRRKPPKEDS